MKNSLKYTLILLLTALIMPVSSLVLADDDSGDWNSIYDSYNSMQFGKPVSDREVENAIKTIKQYKNKGKKDQKDGISTEEKAKEAREIAGPPELPDAAGLLFLLPTNVSFGENTIEKGFYLAESTDKDNSHFIRLTQGEGHIVADIEANATNIDRIQTISGGKANISSEVMENGLLKITLIGSKYILEAYLWTQ